MDYLQPTQQYAPNQPYNASPAYQTPATILEPAEYDLENGAMRLTTRPFELDTHEFGNPVFLSKLAHLPIEFVSQSTRKYDWDYSSRHKAQPILPFLFLGPASAARDTSFIQEAGITLVIAVRSAQAATMQPKLLQPSRFPSCAGLQTATFDVDNPYEVITRMKPTLQSINDHLELKSRGCDLNELQDVKGKILVVCESGNERSPAIIAAYLMVLYGFSWRDAVNLIHAHRFSICLNSSMNDMLRTWEGLLKARSDIALVADVPGYGGGSSYNLNKAPKRTIDDAYDESDDMMDPDNVDLRPGTAPFRDTKLTTDEIK